MKGKDNMGIAPSDKECLEALIAKVLKTLGMDLDNPGLKETPRRFAAYLLEYHQSFNAKEVLGDGFEIPEGFHSMVVQSNIPFRMICEHHLLPAVGTASIGYVPDKRVVGLSKMTRLVQAVGLEKPTLQETIGDRIADILHGQLHPKGVIVVVSAKHLCMTARGVTTPRVQTTTSSVKGIFRDVPAARMEFFELIRGGEIR